MSGGFTIVNCTSGEIFAQSNVAMSDKNDLCTFMILNQDMRMRALDKLYA